MVTSWICGCSTTAPASLALVDEDGDVAHASLGVEPAGLVLERRQHVGPLVDVELREGHVVLRRRDQDVVVADRRFAVVRGLAVGGRGVRRDDGKLVGEDADYPAADGVSFGVRLLHEGIPHLHDHEVGGRRHLFVAWAERALGAVVRVLPELGTSPPVGSHDRELVREIIFSDLDHGWRASGSKRYITSPHSKSCLLSTKSRRGLAVTLRTVQGYIRDECAAKGKRDF